MEKSNPRDIQTFDFNDVDGNAITETIKLSEIFRIRNEEDKVTVLFNFNQAEPLVVHHTPFNDNELIRLYERWQDTAGYAACGGECATEPKKATFNWGSQQSSSWSPDWSRAERRREEGGG